MDNELMDILGEPDWRREPTDERLRDLGHEKWVRYDGLIEVFYSAGTGWSVGIRDNDGYCHVGSTISRKWRHPEILTIVFEKCIKELEHAMRNPSVFMGTAQPPGSWSTELQKREVEEIGKRIERIRAVSETIGV